MPQPSTLAASRIAVVDETRFATHLEQSSYLPAWWIAAKQEAWTEYNALPMPKRTNENWRFANLAGLTLEGFEVPEEPASLVPHLPDFPHASELIFSNRQVIGRTGLPADLAAQGVIFAPLDEALRDHGELVRARFQQHATNLGSEKFTALNINDAHPARQ